MDISYNTAFIFVFESEQIGMNVMYVELMNDIWCGLTIFSSLAGGFRRKKQRGANRMSIMPMMVMSQGKPMLRAIAPPADGPTQQTRALTHSSKKLPN